MLYVTHERVLVILVNSILAPFSCLAWEYFMCLITSIYSASSRFCLGCILQLFCNLIFVFFSLVCPIGTEYRDCTWNLSCSDIIGVRRCKEQSPCTSGCFCSNGTVLQDEMCSNISSCSGIYENKHTSSFCIIYLLGCSYTWMCYKFNSISLQRH